MDSNKFSNNDYFYQLIYAAFQTVGDQALSRSILNHNIPEDCDRIEYAALGIGAKIAGFGILYSFQKNYSTNNQPETILQKIKQLITDHTVLVEIPANMKFILSHYLSFAVSFSIEAHMENTPSFSDTSLIAITKTIDYIFANELIGNMVFPVSNFEIE